MGNRSASAKLHSRSAEPFRKVHHGRSELESVIRDCVARFECNALFQKLESGSIVIADYHTLLRRLFYQVYNSSNSFSLAAAGCGVQHGLARDYLIRHAEEEKTHWTWILNDLKASGYSGPSPEDEFPSPITHAYVAFNFYVSQKIPVARLGIALMLETLGATYGKMYATKICKQLKLAANQASFFFGHGDTDVGHTKELWEIIDACRPTDSEWAWMAHAAQVAFDLYFRIYDEAY